MLRAARAQRLEGVVAKRKDSRYEAGKRSGSWAKYRLNRGQELVIGGFVPGPHGVGFHCRGPLPWSGSFGLGRQEAAALCPRHPKHIRERAKNDSLWNCDRDRQVDP